MFYNLGGIVVLAFASMSGTNVQYPTYEYCAHVNNNQVISNVNVPYETDDDNYRLTVNLGIDFDMYFNTDAQLFLIDNFTLTSTVYTYRQYTQTVVDYDIAQTNVFTYQLGGQKYGYELENDEIIVSWALHDTSDQIQFGVKVNDAAFDYQSDLIFYGNNESIDGEYGVQYTLYFSSLYQQLNQFREQVATASNGYGSGYNTGYTDGYDSGYSDGSHDSYQTGYTDGYNEASDQDSVAVTIFTGICEVGLLPVNVFLGILNFEVFGINIGGFVASLMTIAIVVIVIRVVLGSKSKE